MPEQPRRGAHRAPVGWQRQQKQREASSTDAGPDTQPSPEAQPSQPFPVLSEISEEAPEEALEEAPPSEPIPVPAPPVVVPGQYQSLKRWKLVLVLVAVWIPAAAIGVGLYYWWFHSIDKTWPVFVVLLYVMACTVAALVIAMIEQRPLIAAIAIAVMSAPAASVAGAAVLHGLYFCEHASRCLVGLIPY